MQAESSYGSRAKTKTCLLPRNASVLGGHGFSRVVSRRNQHGFSRCAKNPKLVISLLLHSVNGVRNLLFSPILAKTCSVAFPRHDKSASDRARENTSKFTAISVEEFSTFKWVRCRTGAQIATQVNLRCMNKALIISLLEAFCDNNTWHWVCNHNSRIVSVCGCSPSPAERNQVK